MELSKVNRYGVAFIVTVRRVGETPSRSKTVTLKPTSPQEAEMSADDVVVRLLGGLVTP